MSNISKNFRESIKKNRKRKYLITGILLCISIFLFFSLDIKSIDEAKKSVNDRGGEEIDVSMEILCHTLAKNDKANLVKLEKRILVPDDGILMKRKKFSMKKGETAFDLVKKATLQDDIHIEYVYDKIYRNYYVKGIGNLYEKDGGKESGWQYYVNKSYINYGASSYKLKDGDCISWIYTCNGGRDIEFEN